MDLVQLRAALPRSQLAGDEALQSLESLQSEPKVTTTSKIPECFLLEKIPREIRNQIYKLLLTNEVLSKDHSIEDYGRFHEYHKGKFDLEPQLLRTCRQINAEAAEILYGSNTFIVNVVEETTLRSPVLRRIISELDCHYVGICSDALESCEVVRRVKHWKVVIGAHKDIFRDSEAPTPSFVHFCRAICQHPPKSLTVSIVPRGNCLVKQLCNYANVTAQYHDITEVLKPLRMLRNIKRVSIVAGEIPDFPVYREPAPGEIQPHEISPALITELSQLAQGDKPVKHIFLMYRKLVAYAQTFERIKGFKSDMDPHYGQALHRLRSSGKYIGGGDWGSPYKGNPHHPVENALDYASAACELGKVSTFLKARKAVLEYLEPQYRRILECSLQLLEYIKQHKVAESFLSAVAPSPIFSGPPPAEAMLRLGDYANAFVRDVPWEIRLRMRDLQRIFGLPYAKLPREALMHQLTSLFDSGDFSHLSIPEFTNLFKLAVDDMDTQMLEIRKARKELFDKDFEDLGHDVDLELWRCDEKVNWDINEPQLEPRYLPILQEQLMEAEGYDGNGTYDLVTWGSEI